MFSPVTCRVRGRVFPPPPDPFLSRVPFSAGRGQQPHRRSCPEGREAKRRVVPGMHPLSGEGRPQEAQRKCLTIRVARPAYLPIFHYLMTFSYQMVYGRTPFADLPFIPKMNAICNTQVGSAEWGVWAAWSLSYKGWIEGGASLGGMLLHERLLNLNLFRPVFSTGLRLVRAQTRPLSTSCGAASTGTR